MIKFEKTEVVGLEPAIRGMRNPKNSWANSDSVRCCDDCEKFETCTVAADCAFQVGHNDINLMMQLAKDGPVHAKYRRMIAVYADITAPLYWWKEFDTYKVGTVANSCSTMHKIHAKPFVLADFSIEHLIGRGAGDDVGLIAPGTPLAAFRNLVGMLNYYRDNFLKTDNKLFWWQMIQLLPSSYNQKRTIMLNYEVLAGIYPMRKNHKLDEWHEFCRWIEKLPYSEIITGVRKEDK